MTPTVLETIQELLDDPAATAATTASLEATLTDGYAHALTLEGERLRLERSLRELVRSPGPPNGERLRRIAELTDRVGHADRSLRELRSRLRVVRKYVYDPRIAAEAATG